VATTGGVVTPTSESKTPAMYWSPNSLDQRRSSMLSKSSAVAEMGDRLATVDMERKVGAAVPLSAGELGPHLTQYRLGRGLLPYQVAS